MIGIMAAVALAATGPAPARPGLVVRAAWKRKPTFDEIKVIWPIAALKRRRGGVAKLPAYGSLVVNPRVRMADPAGVDPAAWRVADPVLITPPDPALARSQFPLLAAARGVNAGQGVADCRVTSDGALTDCRPGPATPEGLGFSEAAVKAAAAVRVNLWTPSGEPVDGGRMSLAVRFER